MIVQQCAPPDYDPVSHTCTAPYFAESPSVFDALTIEQAESLVMAIALLWATAWIIRVLIRFINRS